MSEEVLQALHAHDAKSDTRSAHIKHHIDTKLAELAALEKDMSESVSDKINIHTGGDSGNLAALIAAMNSAGGGQAGLAAAMSAMGNRGDGAFGGNGIWAILLLALLGRGGLGGLTGGAGVEGLNNLQGAIDTNAILSALGDIKGAIPLAEGQVQNAILEQTIALQQDLCNGFSNIGDKVLNGIASVTGSINALALNNANQFASLGREVATGFGNVIANNDKNSWAITQAISNDGEKTRALIARQYEDTLNRQLTDAKAEIIELRGDSRIDRRSRETEITVTQNVNQIQAQQQQQAQFVQLNSTLAALAAQINRNQQDIINLGTMTGNSQTAANTNIR